MGLFKLRLETNPKGFEKLDEIRSRLRDFSVPFVSIISKWAQGNIRRKFARGAGAELTGVDQQMAQWTPVTTAYYKQKHGPIVRGARQLYPDWLMVRTGALRAALGDVGGFAQFVDAHRAVFGTPMNRESEAAAGGNKDRRPTIFLDRTDRNVIKRELQQYLTLGEGYKDIMWAIAGRQYGLKKEVKELDIAFGGTV